MQTNVIIPAATLALYRRLADGLSDMIEGDRLTAAAVPDDYAWLVEHLEQIVAADPEGAPTPTAAVVINITGGVLQGASATLPLDVYAIDYDDDADEADPECVIRLDGELVVLSQEGAVVDDLPGKVMAAETFAAELAAPDEEEEQRVAAERNGWNGPTAEEMA